MELDVVNVRGARLQDVAQEGLERPDVPDGNDECPPDEVADEPCGSVLVAIAGLDVEIVGLQMLGTDTAGGCRLLHGIDPVVVLGSGRHQLQRRRLDAEGDHDLRRADADLATATDRDATAVSPTQTERAGQYTTQWREES